MSRWLIGTGLRVRFLVLVLVVVMLVFGIDQLGNMPVDVYPEFAPPVVEIQTEALGLSAEEMEALLTVPLEADLLNGVAWLDQIYSETVTGLSSILLVFEPGTDPIRARQMVQERLTQTFALPNVSKPPTMLQPLSTTNRVMMVGLSSSEISLIDLSVLARWTILPRLLGVPGVANVSIWGQREWQLQVLVDPERLQDTGVTLDQVIATTGEALWVSPLSYLESSSPGTAGWIDTPNQRLTIRHELPIQSASDMAIIPVQGTAWRLGDVAQLVEDHQPLIGDAIVGEGDGLILVIEKFPGANALQVTAGVDAAMKAMRAGLTGVEIDTNVFRSSNYIEAAGANLLSILIATGVLVIISAGAFLYSWRMTLVSLLAILLSLVGALFVLYLRGATFNVMVLTGLLVALGLVIDDVLLDMDHLKSKIAGGLTDLDSDSRATMILRSFLESRSAVSVPTIIVLITVLPVFFLPGPTNSFLSPLAVTYLLAVFASLMIALLVTPALSYVMLAGSLPEMKEPPVVERVIAFNRGLIKRAVHAPRTATITGAVLLITALLAIPFLEVGLLTELKQPNLRIQWDGPPGTSRVEMQRITVNAVEELGQIPGVVNIGSHVGRAITGDQVVAIKAGEIWLTIDPSADYAATRSAIEEVIAGYPGLLTEVEAFQPERFQEVVSTGTEELTVRVYGYDFQTLEETARQVSLRLAGIEGVSGIEIEELEQEPQVEIEVDLAAAERYQVKPGDVRRSATTLLSGLQVGNLYEEQKVFEVIVWSIPEVRENLTDIENLLIDTPRGGHVRLGEVSDIRIAPAPVVIQRDAVSRFIDIRVHTAGRSLTAVAMDIEKVVESVPVPFEYHVNVLGDFGERQAAVQRVWIASLIGLLGIFLLLRANYQSFWLAFAVVLSWPTAISGGVIGLLLLDGGRLSIGSIFGLLAVFGLAVRNGVQMVTEIYEAHAREKKLTEAMVVQAAGTRVWQVLMRSTVITVGMVPILLAGDRIGLEVLQPAAVVVFSGMFTVTFSTLVLIPAIYLRIGKRLDVAEMVRNAWWRQPLSQAEGAASK